MVKNILIILFAIFIDINLIALSIVAFKISRLFGVLTTIGVGYVIILSIVVVVNYLELGD